MKHPGVHRTEENNNVSLSKKISEEKSYSGLFRKTRNIRNLTINEWKYISFKDYKIWISYLKKRNLHIRFSIT